MRKEILTPLIFTPILLGSLAVIYMTKIKSQDKVVAVVEVSGYIDNTSGVSAKLEALSKVHVDAVLLKVDSKGGNPAACEEVRQLLTDFATRNKALAVTSVGAYALHSSAMASRFGLVFASPFSIMGGPPQLLPGDSTLDSGIQVAIMKEQLQVLSKIHVMDSSCLLMPVTGREAVKCGLADSLGTTLNALAYLRSKLGPKIKVMDQEVSKQQSSK